MAPKRDNKGRQKGSNKKRNDSPSTPPRRRWQSFRKGIITPPSSPPSPLPKRKRPMRPRSPVDATPAFGRPCRGPHRCYSGPRPSLPQLLPTRFRPPADNVPAPADATLPIRFLFPAPADDAPASANAIAPTRFLVNDAPIPADDAPASADDAPVPADDAPAPADDAPVPVDDAPVPADDAPVPADDAPVPVDDAPVPADDAPAPADDTPVPADDAPASIHAIATVTATATATVTTLTPTAGKISRKKMGNKRRHIKQRWRKKMNKEMIRLLLCQSRISLETLMLALPSPPSNNS